MLLCCYDAGRDKNQWCFLCCQQQHIEMGSVCALHTYDQQLNQHPLIHVSATRGGPDVKHGI
ncbi:hypothetical protein AV903_16515 [Erwinia tracheiphila]|uniref:Transposase IS801/IS1294 domain-containing protein n=1 Tax=Erwinia tracheiphila TaxID=65700 RepID=A0A345CV09_9GAMM|nr:hypothetical protein AV903_16515 [Erwinia tracheiphila]